MKDSAPTAPFSVDGKSAIITGAGSGINYSFAKLLLEKNCNVVIADLALRPEAQKLIDEYTTQPRAVFVKTDVVMWDQLTNMFDVAEKEFGGADIVCPGAGIFEPHWTSFWHPPGTEKSRDDPHGANGVGHYACLDINLVHPIRTTQLAISRWLNPSATSTTGKASPSNPKRIVHISSIAGQIPGFPVPLYIASKHGMNGLIRSLAPLDAAIGIRVNGVAPGIIKTPLWTEHAEKMQMVTEAQVWVEPEEVAEVMLRCVTDEAIGGGYVMEVLKNRTRNVEWRMDPGPEGPGAVAGNNAVAGEEVLGWLAQEGWGVGK